MKLILITCQTSSVALFVDLETKGWHKYVGLNLNLTNTVKASIKALLGFTTWRCCKLDLQAALLRWLATAVPHSTTLINGIPYFNTHLKCSGVPTLTAP